MLAARQARPPFGGPAAVSAYLPDIGKPGPGL